MIPLAAWVLYACEALRDVLYDFVISSIIATVGLWGGDLVYRIIALRVSVSLVSGMDSKYYGSGIWSTVMAGYNVPWFFKPLLGLPKAMG